MSNFISSDDFDQKRINSLFDLIRLKYQTIYGVINPKSHNMPNQDISNTRLFF